ncbi:DUF4153 domain-containing protein [Cellulomonas sp. URHD0024]|uniref:DUF4153 domain-containing protein n=1 Tax=Cellulomonas sp. URHD0024 TaxID=1302620 RepID=UPI000427D024|nr:DUF4173 domain-containing protein [Cellulomonas sp. URHD0024]
MADARVPAHAPPAWNLGPVYGPREKPGRLVSALAPFWADRSRSMTGARLALCVVVGALCAIALVGHQPGLGAALAGALVWVAAAPTLWRRRSAADLVTAVLSVALLAVVAIRAAGWVAGLCAVVAAWAGASAVTGARSAPAQLLAPLSWAAGAVRAVPWLGAGVGRAAGSRRGQLLVALRSVTITVGLLVVFGLLFASADDVFAGYLPRVHAEWLPAQLVVGALVAVVAGTFAHLALHPPTWSDLHLSPAPAARRAEWLLPVVALDALVLAFVLVQVDTLVGGRIGGMTYAHYARQGFWQLVVATALTLVVVAVAARRAPDRTTARVALGVLCVATLGVVASALRRMDLYVDTYGLTRLRLLVVVGEVVLGVIVVLVVVAGVRWTGGWLPGAIVQAVAVGMLGLALINPDAQILRHNAAAGSTGPIDVVYLQGLSSDAAPAMDELPEPLRSCVLSQADTGPTWGGPFAWNLGRSRAAEVSPVENDAGCARLRSSERAP